MSSILKVACVQLASGNDVDENIAAASKLIRKARKQGAEFIATPETTSLREASPRELLRASKPEGQDKALAAFQALAAELRVWLLIGSLSIRVAPGKCANRSLLISPKGKIVARYDKIHLFDAVLNKKLVYRESRTNAPGNKAVVVAIPRIRLGLSVCYDLRFPELYGALARGGAELLAVPSAFTEITGKAHWHVLLRARAIETGCFVVAPAQCGAGGNGRKTFGHSLIVDPWGKILAEGGTKPGVIEASIDLSEVRKARERIPALRHHRSFSVQRVRLK